MEDMEMAVEIGKEMAKVHEFHTSLSRREKYLVSMVALVALMFGRKEGIIPGAEPKDMWGALVGAEHALMKFCDEYTNEDPDAERTAPSDVAVEILARVSAGVMTSRMDD